MKRKRPRLVVVDDDPAQLGLLERGLTIEGFEVETREGPIGLTNLIRTFRPAIVLVDVYIPTLRGDRIVELVRGVADPETKYFLISAYTESELRLRATGTTVHGWLSKSLSMTEIGRRLKDSLVEAPRQVALR
ncbi:response regulator [Pendulispora rubella]|uniref:Response regulator n=1 Tax=Pendulispora rubella TaxID=2741070 RepID=A0ABZ2KX96_9BACT